MNLIKDKIPVLGLDIVERQIQFLIKGEDCCPLKKVGETLYEFVEHVSEEERERLNCSNTCAYKHAEKDSDAKYCFKPGKLESSCEEGGIQYIF